MAAKNAKQYGYKVGDRFEVLEDSEFRKGAVIELIKDEGSSMPRFELVEGEVHSDYGGPTELYEHLSVLKPLKTETPYYPRPGDTFTISPNKATGDQRYTRQELTCLGANAITVKASAGSMRGEDSTIYLVKENHDFAPMPSEQEPEKEPVLVYVKKDAKSLPGPSFDDDGYMDYLLGTVVEVQKACLDHGTVVEVQKACLDHGYIMVKNMNPGSSMPFWYLGPEQIVVVEGDLPTLPQD